MLVRRLRLPFLLILIKKAIWNNWIPVSVTEVLLNDLRICYFYVNEFYVNYNHQKRIIL